MVVTSEVGLSMYYALARRGHRCMCMYLARPVPRGSDIPSSPLVVTPRTCPVSEKERGESRACIFFVFLGFGILLMSRNYQSRISVVVISRSQTITRMFRIEFFLYFQFSFLSCSF